ncbi:MAG: cytochrome b [Gammaproteobacteria bacterium]
MSLHFRNTYSQYGLGGRVLHWSGVALLVTLIVTAGKFEDMDMSPEKAELIKRHASWGLIFLLVMFMRVYWRISNENPVRSYNIRAWQKSAARSLHLSIYGVVITQSLIGMANLICAGSGIPFFGFFELPPLMQKQEAAYEISKTLHYVLSVAIYPLFAVHISAAIYHQIFGVLDE